MSPDTSTFPTVADLDLDGVDPPFDYPDYVGTRLRAPKEPLVLLPRTLSELTGPAYGESAVGAARRRPHPAARRRPVGERIVVAGRVLGQDGKPLRGQPWRSGRRTRQAVTFTRVDTHDAPLDPNFSGAGRALSDDNGWYRFVTIKPGAYPWQNHPNAWRPAHIHFSLFGRAFAERLVTQMYFRATRSSRTTRSSGRSATNGHASGWSARSTSR